MATEGDRQAMQTLNVALAERAYPIHIARSRNLNVSDRHTLLFGNR